MSNVAKARSISLSDELKNVPECNLDFISLIQSSDTNGSLNGNCRRYNFVITYQKGGFLLLSLPIADGTKAWEEVLEALKTVCDGFMGVGPICQYATHERKLFTMEWDVIDPDQTLNDAVNNGGRFAKYPASDLVLFGGRKISDYEDDEMKQRNAELEAERVRNARIYGIDTGGYDKEKLDGLTEWALFLEYYSFTKVVWRLNHDLKYVDEAERAKLQRSIDEMQYGVEYLLYYISKRLGIPVNEPEVDEHIRPNREIFMRWYSFYDNHFMHKLSDEEWNAFEAARANQEDVSRFLPVGDWHDYR